MDSVGTIWERQHQFHIVSCSCSPNFLWQDSASLTSPGWKGNLGIALNAKSFRRLTSVSFGWRHQASVSLLWFLSAKNSAWVSCGLSGMDIYSMWKGTEPTVCWIQQLSFSKAVCLPCQCEGDMQLAADVKLFLICHPICSADDVLQYLWHWQVTFR